MCGASKTKQNIHLHPTFNDLPLSIHWYDRIQINIEDKSCVIDYLIIQNSDILSPDGPGVPADTWRNNNVIIAIFWPLGPVRMDVDSVKIKAL